MASLARGCLVRVCSRSSSYQLLQCVRQSSSAYSDIHMPSPDTKIKDATYESKDYFAHGEYTYYDEEFEINKRRLPQPSSITKEES
ncbi:hypothetical protein TrispH2_005193 [Trichoplax sp. H2]|nr:hypothetical protein TrispH2_005193 [Trichoplax sp. H2]|eukprot:RDD42020.1 hypothetical protein TrispH2_005193 [Trichoplax sp. H2]